MAPSVVKVGPWLSTVREPPGGGVQRNERFSGTPYAARTRPVWTHYSERKHTIKLVYALHIPAAEIELSFVVQIPPSEARGGGAMRIGYARVSANDQNLNLQKDALRAAGCERLFTDVVGGAKVARPGLGEALT